MFDKTIKVDAPDDTLSEVGIDLSQVMDGQFGHFIVIVKPPQTDKPWQIVRVWVQVTQIGLDAFFDHSDMITWATGLKAGAPLHGVTISAWPDGTEVLTGTDGLARFPIPEGAAYLTAQLGADQALLPRSSYFWSQETWNRQPVTDSLRWYVFDDRQMYRPGEDVHIKGWLRRVGGGQTGDVGLLESGLNALNYRVVESQGNEIGSGQVQINTLGGFDLVFKLPEKVNLGQATISFSAAGYLNGLEGLETYHPFQIQEFRRPEFEVIARNETEAPYFAGGQTIVSVEAKYYAGDALPDAEVTWQVASSPGNYSPPNWPDFTFGVWQPWWLEGRFSVNEAFAVGEDNDTQIETFNGKTDAAGKHYLTLDLETISSHQPISITAEATVMDVNRQAWTDRTNLLVHPAEVYIGLRSQRYFVARNTPLKIDFIVTDLDGNLIAGRPVELRAARLAWKTVKGEWIQEEVDIQRCSLDSALEPLTCIFETPIGGEYRITAEVSDIQGRKNQTQLTRWVSGGGRPPARKVEQEEVTLIPDKESYQPGDTAQILIQSPWSPAEGLLTVSRSGIIYTERFQIETGETTLSIPIEEAYIPNLQIQVDLTGSAVRSDDQGEPLPDVPARPALCQRDAELEHSAHPKRACARIRTRPDRA